MGPVPPPRGTPTACGDSASSASWTPDIPRNVATQVLSLAREASRTAATTSSSTVSSGGMKQVRTLSTSGSSNASRRACANWSAVASEGRETGPCEISRSQLSAACAVRAPSASELPTTATRWPAGKGWWMTSWATSKSWWTFSTRMTPACRSIAPNAPAGTCVCRTRWPGGAP